MLATNMGSTELWEFHPQITSPGLRTLLLVGSMLLEISGSSVKTL
jgi:hypothetical protein